MEPDVKQSTSSDDPRQQQEKLATQAARVLWAGGQD